MNRGWISAFRGKRILLLQGPVGPFFTRLAADLARVEATVFKVNFNGGDWLFSPPGSINYRGTPENWPRYCEQLLEELDIEVVMLFGDCRAAHRVAHEIAHRRGIEIGVFEEGYVRPDFVTFERFGVNGHSLIPRSPMFYLNTSMPEAPLTHPVGNTFWYTVLWACLYYLASSLLKPFFPSYRHHRPLTVLESLPWLRALWRKYLYKITEYGQEAHLRGPLAKRYFLVPLQVHTDAQVQIHSRYGSVKAFIVEVMESFARQAPADTVLVIKHHPLDRAYRDYSGLIRSHARGLGILSRVIYIHDQHLPTLLDNARGVVVINSTVGLSAIHHGTPTKVCGTAIYDMQGLTSQVALDDFWLSADSTVVDRALYWRFLSYTVTHTQINGSFYKRLYACKTATGLMVDHTLTDVPAQPPLGTYQLYSNHLHGEALGAIKGSGAEASVGVRGVQRI